MSQITEFVPAKILRSEKVNGREWILLQDSRSVRYWTPWTCGRLYPDRGGLEKSVPASELNREPEMLAALLKGRKAKP